MLLLTISVSDDTLPIHPTCIEQIPVQSYIYEAVFNVLLNNPSPVPVAISQEMPMHSTENVNFPQGKQRNAIPLCYNMMPHAVFSRVDISWFIFGFLKFLKLEHTLTCSIGPWHLVGSLQRGRPMSQL